MGEDFKRVNNQENKSANSFSLKINTIRFIRHNWLLFILVKVINVCSDQTKIIRYLYILKTVLLF